MSENTSLYCLRRTHTLTTGASRLALREELFEQGPTGNRTRRGGMARAPLDTNLNAQMRLPTQIHTPRGRVRSCNS
jgi:hypothetical protein